MSSRKTITDGLQAALREIGSTATKAAAATAKKADSPISEPGEHSGQSSHPTAKADDGLQKAVEGARSSENEADVKKLPQGSLSPNSTPEVTDRQDEVQPNMGTTQSATGDDPSVEDGYKGDKDDPGTTHPAKTDDGVKYGSWNYKQLAAETIKQGNELLADVAAGRFKSAGAVTPATKAAASAPTTTAAAATGAAPPAAVAKTAAETGYELAQALGLQAVSDADLGRQFLQNTIKEAELAGELTIEYLRKFAEEDRASEGEDHNKPGDAASGASDSGSDDGQGSGGDAGGGEGSGPASPPSSGAEGGGGDLMAAMQGMAPAGPGAGGMGPSPEEVLNELAAALIETGIDPAQLVAAAAGGAGGAAPPMGGDPLGGGAPPMGGPPAGDPLAGAGAPPPGGDPMAAGGLPKLAAAGIDTGRLMSQVMAYKRSGKFEFSAPKTARAQALRKEMRSMLAELS